MILDLGQALLPLLICGSGIAIILGISPWPLWRWLLEKAVLVVVCVWLFRALIAQAPTVVLALGAIIAIPIALVVVLVLIMGRPILMQVVGHAVYDILKVLAASCFRTMSSRT